MMSVAAFIALMTTEVGKIIVALVAGGGLIKFLDWTLARRKQTGEDRRNLIGEVNELVERVDKLEEEVTFWRTQYYREQEEKAALRVAMINQGLTPPETLAIKVVVEKDPTE
jgi:hypothetical protein